MGDDVRTDGHGKGGWLPTGIMASAAAPITFAFLAARALSALELGKTVPATFAASSVLVLAEWALSGPARGWPSSPFTWPRSAPS